MTIASHAIRKENGDTLLVTIEPGEETVKIALREETRHPSMHNTVWMEMTHHHFAAMLAKVGYMNIDAIAVRVQERIRTDTR